MNKTIIPQFQVRSNVRSGQGGGWVNGEWYADRSGVCGGFDPLPPFTGGGDPITPNPIPGSGGGYVGGVWVADRSGSCG